MSNVDASIGATQIGSTVMTFLFGICTLQSYHYIYYYPRDSLWLKSLVSLVWLVGASHTISVTAAAYSLTVLISAISPRGYHPDTDGFIWAIVLSGVMTSLVQTHAECTIPVTGVLCTSCPSLLKKAVHPSVLLVHVGSEIRWELIYYTGGTASGIFRSSFEAMTGFWPRFFSGEPVWTFIIAASMCYYLKREKVFAIARTAKMLDKLMVYSIVHANTLFVLRRVHVLSKRHFSKEFPAGVNSDCLRSAKSASVGPHLGSLPEHPDVVIEITHETQEHRDESLEASGPCIAT
ncbi:hypothetical protein BU15DRAFT_67397 [Melanogaster broomeanus]|nr:hypothetical protein BU15DRAFT_67397 [Melanogaster broomeanus]